ncbi:putative leucine-rich repeat-containing protein DDB_G0290503 isoform X2 [Magallana gigas]|uniref:putative leucine-rich repeat-containing protein DDB_G0290503 isoform X2 n=1 Tax=Magallana gigas TaxID=29159 RepID=UPI0033414A9F
MSKSGHKTPDFLSAVTSEDSTPHYARSTKESRNKEVKKVQKNRISPSRSPSSVYDHEPNLFTRSQSSNNARGVFNERLESEINNYKRKLSERDLEIERLRCKIENDKEVYEKHLFSKHKEIEIMKSNLSNDHRDCKKRLSVKDKEIEKLKGMVEVGNNRQKPKMFKYEEDKKKQSNIIKELEIQVIQNREEHDDLKRKKIEYENKLQEYLEVISTCKDEKARLTSELQKRVTENKKMRETSMEQQEKIREHETTLEKMRTIIKKYIGMNNSIIESNVEKEDRIRNLEKNLNQVEMMKEDLSRRFEEVSKDLRASEKDYKLLHIEFEKGNNRIKQLKEKECGINDLQMQLDAKMEENNRLTQHISRYSDRVTQLEEEIRHIKHLSAQQRMFTEEEILQAELADNKLLYKELSKQFLNLKTEKENADKQIKNLTKNVLDKERELKSLLTRFERSEENVSILSEQLENMRKFERQADDEKLQGFQTENITLKLALTKATTTIEDLSIKCTDLSKYRTDAEHKINELSKAEEEKETLRKDLARSEEKVSELSKEIKDIKVSKRQTADEKLQGFQAENDSLKSALSKASTKIEDLSNKCTNLKKYRTDTEHKLSKQSNAVVEKENEIKSLNKDLARAKEEVLTLTKEIKDIQYFKSQISDDKLRVLQKENASLESALAKKITEMEDLLNKYESLKKYSADAEHKLSKLSNAVEEKDNEINSLRKDLTKSEKNVLLLSKEIEDIRGSKRKAAEENLQDFQAEIFSIKSTLAKTLSENEDLLNKCSDLRKCKTDLDQQISKLLNLLEEKDNENKSLNKDLARAEEKVSTLSSEIKAIQNLASQISDDKLGGLQKENASLESALAKKTTEMGDLLNKYTNSKKYSADAEHKFRKLSNAVEEKENEVKKLQTEIKRLKAESTDLHISKGESDKKIGILTNALLEKERDIEFMAKDLERLNDMSQKYHHLKVVSENAEHKIKTLSKRVQDKENEIEKLVEKLEKANEELDRLEHIDSEGNIQKLREENVSLKSALSKQALETDKRVSALTKEIKNLQKSKETSSEEYNARKLYEENEFLKAQLDRTSKSYEQLRRDYNEVKREKDHALNRLSSVAGEKLRNNNPGIADLSDENRPINLGEKFSQLYDDQWTDAIEHLEEMGYSETDGIRRLLDILKAVFDECVRLSDIHFNQLKELTGTSHLPSDQLKKLKDLRKATAVHSVAKIKQVVNDYMSTAFSKEKAACQTYIDRSIELCWLMSVQDPPVVIDFIAVHGQAIDDKILRKFTKTGSKIDFLVWPVIRLHKNGPLLQKGVVQPI